MTKPAKARVEEEEGARPFGPVSTAATEGWKTRPWSFNPRAQQAISFGGPVAEESFGIVNEEEPVEKALMASSSVAVTLHPRTAPAVTSLPLEHQRNLCPVRYGNFCQGEHQRLCQGEHQRRVEWSERRGAFREGSHGFVVRRRYI